MKFTYRILRSIFIIAIPVIIILAAIRIALLPVFVTLEYNFPGFPEDSFGFSKSDRLRWANYSIGYLLGKYPDEVVKTEVLADGSKLFNDREFSHMQDVRDLTQIVLIIWRVLISTSILTIVIAIFNNDFWNLLLKLRKGVIISFLLIILILVFVALNFNFLFTKFHEIFFEGDSWLFYPSDNLIRLFPLRFWRDLFIFIAGTSLLLGTGIYLSPALFDKSRRDKF